MSFQKAGQLLDLATLAAARRFGITLDDVIERFGISKRTAQRMLRALEMQFPDLQDSIDIEGRKRWQLPPAVLRDLMTLTSDELTGSYAACRRQNTWRCQRSSYHSRRLLRPLTEHWATTGDQVIARKFLML